MTSGRQDRRLRSLPIASKPALPTPEPTGEREDGGFRFKSPRQEEDWQRQAYRQSVRPEGWQAQPPVDHQMQAALDGMPEVGAGQYFRGPDGKHRRITTELREDRDVQFIRRRAFHDFAKTGVTWEQLGAYDPNQPHPGEDEAIAIAQAKTRAESPDSAAAWPNKMRDMGTLPTMPESITRVTDDLDLSLGQFQDPWNGESAKTAPPPILVASNDKAGTIPGWLKGYTEPAPVAPARPLPGSQQRRAYNEGLVGHPANDNSRPAANDNLGATRADGNAASIGKTDVNGAAKARLGAGGEAETDPDVAITDRLFNWSRRGEQPPAPSEFVIHAASNEGRFTYLEEMKDEWSQQLGVNPEKVFRSMQGEVEKIANAAQQDFVTSRHRSPTASETAEINDAVAKIVFAPAEHWGDAGKSPNHRGGEFEQKPYIALQKPTVMSGEKLAEAFDEVAVNIAQEQEQKTGGRPGSEASRKAAALISKKLAAAIRACGGKATVELHGPSEPQIQYIKGQVTGSRYPDSAVPFEINGRSFGAYVSHFTPTANGVTMNLREAVQWDGLIENIGRAIIRGDLGVDAAGIGAVPKQAKNQTDEEYLKMIDDLVKDMIDCRRPFLIKLDINPKKIPSKRG